MLKMLLKHLVLEEMDFNMTRKKHKYRKGEKFKRKWTGDIMVIDELNYNKQGTPSYSLNNGKYKYTESVLENEIEEIIFRHGYRKQFSTRGR